MNDLVTRVNTINQIIEDAKNDISNETSEPFPNFVKHVTLQDGLTDTIKILEWLYERWNAMENEDNQTDLCLLDLNDMLIELSN